MTKQLNVVIIDMQPITPAVGGGRQRLLGLYHALGPNIAATYVGSYDWQGEPKREHQLTTGLREIVVPLSDAHHAAAKAASDRIHGRVVIDCLFPKQVHLSPEFLTVAREHMAKADVVVFSHPWAFPPLADSLSPAQLVVYDSQNVEAVLRTDLLGDLTEAADVLQTVVEAEYDLCRRADLILTCSHDDRQTFAALFDLPMSKLRIVPNGIFAFDAAPANKQTRAAAKAELGLDQSVCIFVGSNYGPNNDAAHYIATELATRFADVCFAIVGGCNAALQQVPIPGNVRTLGVLDEAEKRLWLTAADVSLNPLSQGSGTSIKMFDFMAAGVPVLTTAPGARGIIQTGRAAFRLASRTQTPKALRELLAHAEQRDELAGNARKLVENHYAWERISPRTGMLLRAFYAAKHEGRKSFSVIIPSYERPGHLDRLFERLEAQTERSFEVIVIDQSASPWHGSTKPWTFQLTYVHSPVKGAVVSRNTGGELATGAVIAFTDDDCEPLPDWLRHALRLLEQPDVVGIEGRVESDHLDDPEWRSVSNVNFAGLGFMTANLLVRNEVFQALDGFDLAFDEPHFREDTEFGWRMQTLGNVPYSNDVRVFHPAHRRDQVRESSAERNKFFEKDALLYRKHRGRYIELLLAEGHWQNTPGFWENFERGANKYAVELGEELMQYRDLYRATL
ncbi:glycosyltransferase [Dyella silvae]|uniref:glycosyltransferase n=1 Tax=Dyella silvae TaxID=2994424 RepID=UPI0022649701|nr:glycosyltransferase [Dyella silvae]